MIKNIGDNHRIYGFIIVKIANKLLVLDYGFSNAIFEPPNHAFARINWGNNLFAHCAPFIKMTCTKFVRKGVQVMYT